MCVCVCVCARGVGLLDTPDVALRVFRAQFKQFRSAGAVDCQLVQLRAVREVFFLRSKQHTHASMKTFKCAVLMFMLCRMSQFLWSLSSEHTRLA